MIGMNQTGPARRRSLLGASAVAIGLALAVSGGGYAAQERVATYDIQEQSLADALREYGRVSGIQIIFTEDLVRDRRSPAVHGAYSSSDALDLILAETDLEARRTAGGAVMIVVADYPQSAGGAAASPNTSSRPLRENSTNADGIGAGTTGNGSLAAPGAQREPVPAGNSPRAASTLPVDDEGGIERITITGTHIRGVSPTAPVQIITRDFIDQAGFGDVGDVVRSLPQNFSGGQNPGVVGAAGGGLENQNLTNASTVNLRGIGTGGTLVLLNGRRLANHGFFQAPDVSGIPLGAVERVEVVSDGSSALYGSDAVAGVVNFILQNDYDGLDASARLGGATEGGGFEQTYGLLGGRTWAHGYILSSIEYEDQEPIVAGQRSVTADLPPTDTLYRDQQRLSLFASGGQSITNTARLQIDGLYSERSTLASQTVPGISVTSAGEMTSYFVSPSLDVDLVGGWGANTHVAFAETVNDLKVEYDFGGGFDRRYTNDLQAIEVRADGPLFALRSGDVSTAVGFGYRQESFRYDILTSGARQAGSRSVRYGFGEVLVPVISGASGNRGDVTLDVSLAGRYEEYSDFGSTFNPKIGVRWSPLRDTALRGTWGTSFKAPSFNQTTQDHEVYLYEAADIFIDVSGPLLLDYGGNPDLGPEKSESWTVGLDWSPQQQFYPRVTITYFDIRYEDRIVQPLPFGSALLDPMYEPFITRNPAEDLQASAIAAADRFNNYSGEPYDPSSVIALAVNRYVNASAQHIRGVDLGIAQTVELGAVSAEVFGDLTWLDIKQRTLSGSPFVGLTGELFQPAEWRSRVGVTARVGGFTATALGNYVSGGRDSAVVPSARVDGWTTFDLNLGYRLDDYTGFISGTDLSLTINNVFNEEPPYAAGAAFGYDGIYYDSTKVNPLGRFISATIRKRF